MSIFRSARARIADRTTECSGPEAVARGTRAERVGVGVVLLPNGSKFELYGLVETLQEVNRLQQGLHYDIRYVRALEGSVAGGLEGGREGTPLGASIQYLVVCGSEFPGTVPNLLSWLRRHHRHGGTVAAISDAALALADAGLLDGRRCAVQRHRAEELKARTKRAVISTRTLENDNRCITCAGGTSVVGLALELASEHVDERVVREAARNLFYHWDGIAYYQPIPEGRALGGPNRLLSNATRLMADTLETPLSLKEVAASLNVSVRHLERQFRRHLNTTPRRFYSELRLRQGRRLLQDGVAVTEAAFRSGYSSPSHFAKSYKALFGTMPSEDRRAYALA